MLHRLTVIFALAAMLAAPSAQARMYQWINPESGTTQLSGIPPAWYRSGSLSGPRVFVFDNGQIIDDTAVPLPSAAREALRREAFSAAAEGAVPAEAEPATASRDDEAGGVDPASDVATLPEEVLSNAPPPPPFPAENRTAEPPPPKTEVSEDTIRRMKGVIADWEREQTDHARELIESDGGAGSPPPPPASSPPPAPGAP